LQTARHPLVALTLQLVIFAVEYASVFVCNGKFSSALDRTSQKKQIFSLIESNLGDILWSIYCVFIKVLCLPDFKQNRNATTNFCRK